MSKILAPDGANLNLLNGIASDSLAIVVVARAAIEQ